MKTMAKIKLTNNCPYAIEFRPYDSSLVTEVAFSDYREGEEYWVEVISADLVTDIKERGNSLAGRLKG